MEIKIQYDTRPCYVNDRKAIFHRFSERSEIIAPSIAVGGHKGGTLQFPVAVVEYEDGTVCTVPAWKVRFADGGDFSRMIFLPLEYLDKKGEEQ